MTPSARLSAALELLDLLADALRPGGAAADRLLAGWLRERRYIGSKDRRWLTQTYWHILRHWGRQTARLELAGLAVSGADRLALYLYDSGQAEMLDIWMRPEGAYAPDALTAGQRDAIGRVPATDSVRAADELQDWQISFLQKRFADSISSLVEALDEPAPLDVRLQHGGTQDDLPLGDWQPLDYVSGGWRRAVGVDLQQHQAYREGRIEVQDHAAQVASALVDARPGDCVVDLCAGAGGKALALRQTMQSTGRLIALEPVPQRLRQLEQRDARCGSPWIETRQLPTHGAKRQDRLASMAAVGDRVVVDAPCSGSGTWRRNPDLRWRYGADDITDFATLQGRLLDDAAGLCKPGGQVIYMTCSLYAAENDAVVSAFLDRHADFACGDWRAQWHRAGLGAPPKDTAAGDPRFLQLTPSVHGCDGFFIAVLDRG